MKSKKRNSFVPKVLILLVLLDLIATSIWFNYYGIGEANPFMSSFLEKSTLNFAITKICLSLPSIWLLNKFQNKVLARFGLVFLTIIYTMVAFIHYFVFVNL